MVAAEERAVFSLGRLPSGGAPRRRAEDFADRLHAVLDGAALSCADAGRKLGVPPNALRYAAATGRVLIRWDGSRRPTMRAVPRPEVDLAAARLELARRNRDVFGPTAADAFAEWEGIAAADAHVTHAALAPSPVAVQTPVGDACILEADEPGFRSPACAGSGARLLPRGGDAHYLLQGRDRHLHLLQGWARYLLLAEAGHREAL